MKGKMKAAVLVETGKVRYEERDIPTIREDQVLVKMMHCGICGSDVHYYQHGRIGDFVVREPMVLGHEGAGRIVEVGAAVHGLVPGDIVTMEPGIPCGHCRFCKTGNYNLCPDVIFFATPPVDGIFQEYVAHPASMCFKLPEGMDTVSGALIEPLSVGFFAAEQGWATVGQSAVVLGSGCIGLCTLMALKARGVNEVYVADVFDIRLDKAMELGAAGVINASREDTVARILELTGGEGTDLVFETAGSRITTQQTPKLVKRGGTIVMVGMAPDAELAYDLGTVVAKQATIRTVFRYRNLYPTCIDATCRIPLPLKSIVTKYFPFDRIPEAIEYNIQNKSDTVKVVIEY
ncbi:MAG: NAD(P)-dependent alcohol dehydrogenase [Clostridia bacterium]|nr:NAD(P)-dependent alcohol dehydrogenase [Clostridia bacterium]